MRLPFRGQYRLTQPFGVNEQDYSKFGLKGHNGLDHAAPMGTDLFAMISGVVKEATNDENGYGNYVKIENDKEGALVSHLSQILVKAGDIVVEGKTLIGFSGNSGNSTGPHTHTGYYPIPRDRKNGFNGYIDFTNLLNGGTMAGLPSNYNDIIHGSSQWDDVCKSLELGEAKSAIASTVINTIGGYKSRITVLEGEVGKNQGELKNREEQVSRLKVEIARSADDLKLAIDQKNLYKTDYEEAMKAKGKLTIDLETANKTIETLKGQANSGTTTITIIDFIKLLLSQKITIKKG